LNIIPRILLWDIVCHDFQFLSKQYNAPHEMIVNIILITVARDLPFLGKLPRTVEDSDKIEEDLQTAVTTSSYD
jgi:hypothetical protein